MAPCYGAIHPDEIPPPSFWLLGYEWVCETCPLQGETPARAGQGWLGALGEATMLISLLLTGNPPQKASLGNTSVSAASLFLLLQVSRYFYIRFLSHELFPALPCFFKASFITSLLSPGLMCLARSRRVPQSRRPGPAVEAGRGLLAALPCP